MGKTTRSHPVSLYVIRGATDYCGFKFGRIRQKGFDLQSNTAWYETTIEKMPEGLTGKNFSEIQKRLQGCFMDDITVHWLRQTKKGVLMCDLQVDPQKAAQ